MSGSEVAAYMAGLIDGEGALVIEYNDNERVRPSFYPRISMTQKDRRLLDWVVRYYGGKVYDNNCHGCYQWQCPVDRIMALLEVCLPYLIIKKRKALLMMALRKSILEWKTKRLDGTRGQGNIHIPEEVFQYRLGIYNEFKKDDPDAIISLLAGATTERLDSLKAARNEAQRAIYTEMRQSGLMTLKHESSAEMTEPALMM